MRRAIIVQKSKLFKDSTKFQKNKSLADLKYIILWQRISI